MTAAWLELPEHLQVQGLQIGCTWQHKSSLRRDPFTDPGTWTRAHRAHRCQQNPEGEAFR